jgi:hypothetical protein
MFRKKFYGDKETTKRRTNSGAFPSAMAQAMELKVLFYKRIDHHHSSVCLPCIQIF